MTELLQGSSIMTPRNRVDVLGVGISITSPEAALKEIANWVDRGERQYVCVTNVHTVMECQRDVELLRIHNASGLTVPDGMPIVWCGRLAGAKEMRRVYGPDLMLSVTSMAAERDWSSFYYGAAPGTPELLAARLRDAFPSLQVAGTYSPPFRPLTPSEDDAIVDMINASGADLVWVGLSAPKQERWMGRHRSRLAASVLFGVGAAFDFHAGLKAQAPPWMQRVGLEWSHRLATEPRRLWRRYLINNPLFVVKTAARLPRKCTAQELQTRNSNER